MTCARVETQLALYVERDLPEAEVSAVEAHLGGCAACRRFLDDLRRSQLAVHDLAAEAIDPDALTDLRARVVTACTSDVGASRGRRPSPPLWAAAAAILVAAGATAWIARGAPPSSREPGVAQAPAASVGSVPSPVPALREPRESTARALPRVSPHVDRALALPAHVHRPAAVAALSPDDADQLARAVVAVSRIRSVQDLRPETGPTPEPTPLVQLATADPNVVIYWRLDPNGGE